MMSENNTVLYSPPPISSSAIVRNKAFFGRNKSKLTKPNNDWQVFFVIIIITFTVYYKVSLAHDVAIHICESSVSEAQHYPGVPAPSC